MIYQIEDKPKTIKEYLLYGAQQCLSVITATILISSLCGTSVASGMVGAGIATIVFLCLTGFKVPLFFSNSGSTVSAVALAMASTTSDKVNYAVVIIGGVVVFLMNSIASMITKKLGNGWINKLLPPVVSGTTVLVIGLHLATYCATYISNGIGSNFSKVIVSLITMITTVLVMHYSRGRLKTLPLLIGVVVGYLFAFMFNIVDFSSFADLKLFILPEFAFANCNFSEVNWAEVPGVILAFGCVNLANIGEHLSDVLALNSVVEKDFTKEPGIHKTLFGDGVADLVGTIIGGQPTTTYSESLSTIAISKVASTRVILVGAIMLCALGFIGPFNALVNSIPSCVFAGCALVCYGMIATSGLKTLIKEEVFKQRDIIIIAVMLTIGVSGVALNIGSFSISGIVFSMLIGILLNTILK